MSDIDRLGREQAFHDERFAAGSVRPADRFYSVNAASNAFFEGWMESLPRESALLEYGCGDCAFVAKYAAKRRLATTAIDISPVAIARATQDVSDMGLADRIDFRVADAESTPFAASSFDAVCGLGVLHHLDLQRSLVEIARLLRPGGRALFLEPMGHNPLINLYRRWTPGQRSRDEHPLTQRDLDVTREHFPAVHATFFHFFDLLALPLARGPRLDAVVSRTGAADRLLFAAIPRARRYAWMVGIEFAKPLELMTTRSRVCGGGRGATSGAGTARR